MKSLLPKTLPLALLACGLPSFALAENSFQEATQHLDTDGSFIAYLDFDGDGEEVGQRLNVIYQKLAAANPQVPPFPLDFPQLFTTLGFGSVRAMAASSTEVGDGLQRNRSVALLEGEPAGLFSLYGLEPMSFRAAEFAPADATSVMSGQIRFTELRSTVVNLLRDVMGPMGEGMVQQSLTQPIAGTDLTGNELVDALSGKIHFIMSQSFDNVQEPKTKLWLSFEGAGALLSRLEPLAVEQGIAITDSDAGRRADFSPLMQGAPFGLFALVPAGTNDLTFYTDEGWVTGKAPTGGSLASTEAFQRVASRLPKEAAFYAYSSGFDVESILSALEEDPTMAAYLPLIRDAVDLFAGDLLAPNASAMFRADDAIVTEQYAEYSYKGLLMGIPAGIGAGIGVAAAIQASIEQANADEAEEWDSEEEGWEDEEYYEEESSEGEEAYEEDFSEEQ